MKKLLFTVLAIAAIASCKNANVTAMSGTVPAEGPQSVSIQIPDLGIDTTVAVSDGKFSLDLPVDNKVMGVVTAGDAQGSFIPDGSKLSINVVPDEKVFVVESSSKDGANARCNTLNEWMKGFMEEYNGAAMSNDAAAADSLFDIYIGKMKEIAMANTDNYLGITALSSLRGQVDGSELEPIIDKLEPAFGENEAFQNIKKAVNAVKATAEGAMFSDFTVEETDGTVKKLSDYVGKGKYILTDFWASWCGPCRRELPYIKAAYQKYAGEKFDVLGVAVWDKPEDTAKAVEELGIVWNNISNAQHIPTDIYGIEGIPHLILFGPDGTIVKRGEGLRGENMDKIIGELLK